MMDVTATLKKAPRWAWYTAGGLGLGAAAVKLYRNRASAPTDTTNVPAADVGTTYGTMGGTPPGVIVPPVILGGNTADPNVGVGPLQGMYIGAMGDVLSGWQSLVGPFIDTQTQLLLGSENTIAQIAMAGGPPQSQPAPVVSAVPLPQQTPIALHPKPAGAGWKVETERRTRDNGKTGKARAVWCSTVTIHRYPDGHGVVVGEVKTKNGAC